jgi:hypothetical protein
MRRGAGWRPVDELGGRIRAPVRLLLTETAADPTTQEGP